MTIADKRQAIAETEPTVYDTGYAEGRQAEQQRAAVAARNRVLG